MRKTVTRKIDDLDVTARQLAPMVALEILPEVTAAVSAGLEALKSIESGLSVSVFEQTEDPEEEKGITVDDIVKIAPILGNFSAALGDGKFRRIVPALLTSITRIIVQDEDEDGEPKVTKDGAAVMRKVSLAAANNGEQIDDIFRGRFLTLGKVIAFAIEVNFADFFPVVLRAVARSKAASAEKASTSTPTS